MKLVFNIHVSGIEHVDDGGGLILISNHQSNWDPVFLGMNLKRRLHFMAKSELFSLPFLSFIIKKLGAFPVKRGFCGEKAIDVAVDLIKSGKVLAMFPEGHRSKNGNILKFKTGVVRIALKGNFKILPCSIIYKKGKIRRKIFINYGQAFYLHSIFNGNLNLEQLNLNNLKSLSDAVRCKVVESLLFQKTHFN